MFQAYVMEMANFKQILWESLVYLKLEFEDYSQVNWLFCPGEIAIFRQIRMFAAPHVC